MKITTAALMLAVSTVPAATQEAKSSDDEGELAFNNSCRTCHSTREGDNRLGPSLGGLIGRKAGTVEGYAYSPSMAASNVVWDEATLDKFIANPNAVVPDNNMKPYSGISDTATRSKIVGYLSGLD